MSSSQKTTLAWQRYTPGVLFVAMVVMMVLDQGVLVQTSIHPIGPPDIQTRKGEDVTIAFEYCARSRPDCDPMNFNFSSPNLACKLDRYLPCQLTRVSDNDPRREDLRSDCELCEIVVHGVSQADAGLYAICDVPPPCKSDFWRNLTTLEIKNDEPSTVIPPGRLESTLRASSSATTTASAPTKSTLEINSTPTANKPSATESQIGPVLPSAVGIPVTIIIILIVIIIGAVYFYKKRNGWRRHGHTQVPIDETVNENGNTTKTININLTSQDVRIAIVSEDTSLQADPE